MLRAPMLPLLCLAAVFCSAPSPIWASPQEPSETSQPQAEQDEASPETEAAESDDAAETADTGDGADSEAEAPLREQTIYIPYSKIRGIFEKEGRGVFIPYEQFQSLWQRARAATHRQPDDPKPPVDALISEINSEAEVEKDVVRVTATMQIELLGKGWHEIPLRLGDAAILAAKVGDDPARIMPSDGGYKLLIEKSGKSADRVTAEITYAKAFTKSPGRNSVEFLAPQAPVNQWRIRVPQAGVKVNIHPMIAATEETRRPSDAVSDDDAANTDDEDAEKQPAADETVVLAFVGAAPTVRIDWTPRSEGASGMAALATAQSRQQLTIEEGIVRASTWLQYSISRAELAELQIEVPKGYKVTGVLDANVRGWQVEADGEVQRISVQLFQPAKGSQTVLVELERFSNQDAEQSQLQAPLVRALGVGRQHGQVVVRLAESLRGEVTTRTGLLQIDAAELPAELKQGRWDFAYRFSSLPTTLTLQLQKVQPQIQATQWVEAFVEPEQITLALTARYNIRRSGLFQLAFDVPTDYEIRSVRGLAAGDATAAQYDTHHFSSDREGRLIVNLSAKAIGDVCLTIEMQRRMDDPNLRTPTGEASDLKIPLPRVARDSVEMVTGKWIVYAPESLRTNPTATGLQPIALRDASVGMPVSQASRFPTARPILAYAYAQQDVALELATQRRKPQITARQLLETDVTAGAVQYKARFLFDILYSGVKTLRIDVPTAIASQIRNTTEGVQDVVIQPQPDDVPEGYQAWQFSGETELLGRREVRLNWEQKLAGLGVGQSKDVALPWLRPAGVDRAWGQIVIGKAETLDVRPKGESVGLRPIDPQTDLIDSIRVPGAARAFEFHDDWKLTITATRYELEDVKHTSIERAVLRMVVGADRQTSVQALYRMRSARQRLEVKLPAEFDPGKGFNQNPLRINGRPVPLERGDAGEYYIPLADQSPEQAFVLELRYAVASDQRHLPLPEFPNDPAVQKVYLCAYLPKDQAVVGTGGPWDNDLEERWRRQLAGYRYNNPNDNELVVWVTDGIAMASSPTSDFQTQGLLYTFSTAGPPQGEASALRVTSISKDMLDAAIFLLIAVPGVILVTQSMTVRLFAVGIALFGLVFSSVFLPSLSLQLFDSVLFLALFLVLAVWILMGLMRWFRSPVGGQSPPPDRQAPRPPQSPDSSGTPPSGTSQPTMAMSATEPSKASGLFGQGGLFGWSQRRAGGAL
ncbi:hypothetical protein [Rosistilla oblonga]|uniref:hypothetical protein n=1 Tax=Rosistilla oblonga TaxID=2527990 RepID=UPI003A9719CE